MSKVIAVQIALFAACTPVVVSPPPPPPDLTGIEVVSFPAAPVPLDLLFVIDDSPSMADKQAALAASFPRLIDQLQSLDGGIPDLHLGVISTDMGVHTSGEGAGTAIGQIGVGGCAMNGDNGALLVPPATLLDPDDHFVKLPREGSANFSGTLATTFGSMARLGAGGCGFEQPLASIEASLLHPDNAGFHRADASLAVIVLSDEDDCSATQTAMFGPQTTTTGPLQSFRCFRFGVECAPDTVNEVGVKTGCRPRQGSTLVDEVAPYRDLLLGAKNGDPRRVMVGAIVGATSHIEVELRSPPGGGTAINALRHSCDIDSGMGRLVADPAVRLASFVDGFTGRKALASVCSTDLAPAANDIGKGLKRLIGDRCLERAIPEPMDCTVTDERDGSEPRELLACSASSAGPCFTLVDDATCALGSRLEITRATPADPGTFTAMYCRGQ